MGLRPPALILRWLGLRKLYGNILIFLGILIAEAYFSIVWEYFE